MESKPWLNHYDPGVPAHLEYPRVNAFYFLDEAARKHPDGACTLFKGVAITFQEMAALTDRLAAALVANGLRRGERVGLLLPNTPQFVLTFYAALKAGGVAVAINPQYRPREILYQVNDAGVRWLFSLDDYDAALDTILPQTGIRQVITTNLDDFVSGQRSHAKVPPGRLRLLDWLTSAPEARLEKTVSADDLAIFQYTGGTTGVPKGAIGLHRNLVANTLQVRSWLVNAGEGRERVLMAIPMFHVYGLVLGMSLALALMSPLVLVHNPRDLPDLLANIQRHRPTLFPGVPTLFNAINAFPEVQNYDLHSLKVCISGSAPLMAVTKARFEALTGGRVCEGYGLSEAPTATHCNPVMGENRPGSIGLPWPDVDCRIVSLEDGEGDVAIGEAGELLVRGPQVMQGYHNMPGETAATLRGGWLHTGDIARMDADGYFYIVDRKKELIKVGGYQVWPREVEDVIAAHPKVFEVAAAGLPDAYHGETVKAWVVLKPGQTSSEEEIQAWCREYLAPFKVPTRVEFREQLPKSAVGKILRRELVREEQE